MKCQQDKRVIKQYYILMVLGSLRDSHLKESIVAALFEKKSALLRFLNEIMVFVDYPATPLMQKDF